MIRNRISSQRLGMALVPFLAVIATWLTGFVQVYQSVFGFVFQYGLPLSWKTRWPMQYLGYTDHSVGIFVYSWDVFTPDALLYAGLGYLFILSSMRESSLFRNTLIVVSSAWVACATALFSWSAPNGSLTDGLPVAWRGLGLYVWSYNLALLASDVMFIAALAYLALFLYRGIRRPKSPEDTKPYDEDSPP